MPIPKGLIHSFALVGGAALTVAVLWPMAMPVIAASDLASVAILVGGTGVIAWAAAQISTIGRITPFAAFAAGVMLPVSTAMLLSQARRRSRRAANDNDPVRWPHPFSGSWPQFINE